MQTVALDAFVSEATEARDDAISALRESVGLIPRDDGGLDALSSGDRARFEQELREIGRIFQRADVAAFVDHIDYAVQLIGLDHVGISSDFDGGGGVEGWDDASESFNVTLELVRRGYSEAEIARLWGGNLLRALRRVEEVAASWP
jgi:membrane dipeptidase